MAVGQKSNKQPSANGKPSGKHIPERTCVACRTERPKRHLVRLVRLPEGGVAVDKTGRKAGRGAYLCPAQECWRLAKARKSLDQALAITVSADTWALLEEYAQRLPEARL
jgi:predicted RNA-binding protein YlxR (DUF448 family)